MYGVVETSKVKAVKVGRIHSVLAELPTGLECGMIVKVGDLAVGEKINQELGISIALFGQFANVIAAGKTIMQAFSAIQVRERRATEG